MSFRLVPLNTVAFLRTKNLVQGLTKTQPLYYVGYPRYDPIEFPVVAVTPFAGTRTPMSIGDTGNRFTLRYQIDIYTNTNAFATINTDKYSQNELIGYIADKISECFKDYGCEFRSTFEYIDSWITPLRLLPYEEDSDTYRGVMTLTVQLNDPRT